ncbi:MAG: ComF family protein [Oscillospiraceae bacterium]|nr:ComF family protein [Oscillospiraceae bacterium]
MRLLDLIYPPRCVLCHDHLPRGGAYTCEACSRRLLRQEPIKRKLRFLDGMVAVAPYEEPYRGSVQRFKFGGCAFYAYPYADWLSACIRSELGGAFELVTWAPVSASRSLRRGYDQARLIAVQAAKRLDAPLVRCLRKKRHNPAQSGLKTPEQRRANVTGVYRAVKPERFAGKRILLIDDVVTTGATVEECARVLLTAGAASVVCASVATVK